MSFNITCRADNKADLQNAVDEQAKGQKTVSKEIKEIIDAAISQLPDLKDGYIQLTAYGHIQKDAPSNIVLNLSSHQNDG